MHGGGLFHAPVAPSPAFAPLPEMPSSSMEEEQQVEGVVPASATDDGSGSSVADRMWNRNLQIKPVPQMRNGPAGAGYIG